MFSPSQQIKWWMNKILWHEFKSSWVIVGEKNICTLKIIIVNFYKFCDKQFPVESCKYKTLVALYPYTSLHHKSCMGGGGYNDANVFKGYLLIPILQ